MGNGVKISAALNATLTIPAFAQSPNNYTVYFGGEGTVDLQFALGGTITTVSVNKEDSGTLKMSTNDKTYLAPTNIGAGTLWCDGPTRISGSNLVTVANGARLRAGYSNIGATALSVKALTLAAGSTVQVG
jgi:autotransporter-associated beta strand protein